MFSDKDFVWKLIYNRFVGVKEKDIVCFANLEKNRSVRGIPHYHIFIRKRKKYLNLTHKWLLFKG